MILVFLLAILLALPLGAATPTITGTVVETTQRSATVVWTTNEAGPARLGFDFQGDGIDWVISQTNNDASAGRRSRNITSLPPVTAVSIIPQSRDSGSNWSVDFECSSLTCTNCGPGDHAFFGTNSGLSCTPGEYPTLTTLATDPVCESPPCEAQAPVNDGAVSCPAITGDTRVVETVDAFLEAFDDAKTDAGAGTVEEIVYPAGLAIRAEDQTGSPDRFLLTAIANGGWVVMRPDSDPKTLPPGNDGAGFEGTRTDPAFFPFMGRFEMNTDPRDWDDGIGTIFHESGMPRGYCIENTLFTTPPVSELPVYSFNITAINVDTDVFTTDGDLGQLQNGAILFVDPAASGTQGGFGRRKICNISGSTFKVSNLNDDGYGCGSTANISGSSCSGTCGTFQHWTAREIEAVSNTTPVELTITGHGYPRFPENTITGSTASNKVTASTVNGGLNGNSVYVFGTSIGTCDGVWRASVSGSEVTLSAPLNDSGAVPNCTGAAAGTILRVDALSVIGTSDPEIGRHTPQTFVVFPEDDDTLALLQTTAQGAGITGGFIFSETPSISAFFRFGDGGASQQVEDFICDRCAFVYPFPWNATGALLWARAQDMSVVNSYFENMGRWQRVNPVSGAVESLANASGDVSSADIYPQASDDVQVINNSFCCSPMIYTETPSNVPSSNFRVNGNIFFTPDRYVRTHSTFEGIAMGQTFNLEFKDMDRIEIIGNYFKGARSHRNNSQATIEFSGLGSTTSTLFHTRDGRIEYNTFTESAAGIHLTNDGSIGERIHGPIARFTIRYNLFAEFDSVAYNGFASISGGRLLFTLGHTLDTIVERNTYWAWRAHKPYFWEFGAGGWSQGGLCIDNLLLATEGSFSAIGFAQNLDTTQIPTPTQAAGSAAIAEHFRSGDAADASTDFSGNVIVAGVKNSPGGSLAGKWASDAEADTISRDNAENRAGLDVAGNTFVGDDTPCGGGNCPDALAEREALALEDGAYEPAETYTGKGSPIDVLEDRQGWVTGISVTGDDDELTVSYHAPSTAGCYVQLAQFDTDWLTTFGPGNLANTTAWTQASGGSQAQSVNFSGRPSLTKYYYRIGCKKLGIGEATTGAAGGG